MEEADKQARKIQAFWWEYRLRKGELVCCSSCGRMMTLSADNCVGGFAPFPCSSCRAEGVKKEEEDSCEGKTGRAAFCPTCGRDDCDGLCRECDGSCAGCGEYDCKGHEEPYVPCCVCGGNAYESDYECWKVCSRSCLTEPFREGRW